VVAPMLVSESRVCSRVIASSPTGFPEEAGGHASSICGLTDSLPFLETASVSNQSEIADPVPRLTSTRIGAAMITIPRLNHFDSQFPHLPQSQPEAVI
jgi:hypothetical protein